MQQLSDTEILERLFVYGRVNGQWPIDPDLIHRRQRDEGYEACFGRATCWCGHAECRWHVHCMRVLCTPPALEPLWLTLQTDGVS